MGPSLDSGREGPVSARLLQTQVVWMVFEPCKASTRDGWFDLSESTILRTWQVWVWVLAMYVRRCPRVLLGLKS